MSLDKAQVSAAYPWSDCKIAFAVYGQDDIWDYLGSNGKWKSQVPVGWTLIETDCSGARCVAIFRVETLPCVDDGKVLARLIAKIDQVSKRRFNREMKRDGYVLLPNGNWTLPKKA